MDVIKRLRPGQPGTKRLQRRYGDRLLFVRYRHDALSQRRFTTVELIVDQSPTWPRAADLRKRTPGPNDEVLVRIAYDELELRTRIKAAGGTWDPARRLWSVPYHVARTLALTDRIQTDADVQ